MPRTYLVTGGAGFIGSNFVRYVLEREPGATVLNLDALTYAGVKATVDELDASTAIASSTATFAMPPWSTQLIPASTWSSTSPPRATSTGPSKARWCSWRRTSSAPGC
jgi:NAD(P)-dependent dehydrogenase (short-subunit alcohol dehydrogenase family)